MNPLSQYLMIGKLIALLGAVAIICWQSSQIHRWHKQAEGLSQKLESLTDAKNNQKAETKTRIETVTKIIHDADGRARVVEAAPRAPNCKTKPEVMGADL